MDENMLSLQLISIEKNLYVFSIHYTDIHYKVSKFKWEER